MLVFTLVVEVKEITVSLVAMVTMSRMQTHMPSGVWNVSPLVYPYRCFYWLHVLYTVYRLYILTVLLNIYVDVKMDWCNTEINGSQLDPKTQYPQMVRVFSVQNHPNKYAKKIVFYH